MAKKQLKKVNKARKVKKLIKNLIKPSKLPKDVVTTVRINSIVKDRLKEEGLTVQELFDEAIDKKLAKFEFEKKMTIETKK